jgi:DNA-binding response OmpR family regulator
MSIIILSAGRDSRAVESRNNALIAAGFTVVSADREEFVEKLFDSKFDAVILCHSLHEDERRRLAGITKSYCPTTPVIVVSDLHGRQFHYGTRTVLNYPEQIIASVRELARSGVRSEVA